MALRCTLIIVANLALAASLMVHDSESEGPMKPRQVDGRRAKRAAKANKKAMENGPRFTEERKESQEIVGDAGARTSEQDARARAYADLLLKEELRIQASVAKTARGEQDAEVAAATTMATMAPNPILAKLEETLTNDGTRLTSTVRNLYGKIIASVSTYASVTKAGGEEFARASVNLTDRGFRQRLHRYLNDTMNALEAHQTEAKELAMRLKRTLPQPMVEVASPVIDVFKGGQVHIGSMNIHLDQLFVKQEQLRAAKEVISKIRLKTKYNSDLCRPLSDAVEDLTPNYANLRNVHKALNATVRLAAATAPLSRITMKFLTELFDGLYVETIGLELASKAFSAYVRPSLADKMNCA